MYHLETPLDEILVVALFRGTPLQFREGENAQSLGLDGTETFTIERAGRTAKVTATSTRKDGVIFPTAMVWSIVATAIASFLALLIMAVVVNQYKGGGGWWYWTRFALGIVLYVVFVAYTFPKVGRWFLRRNEDSVTQYIFVLVLLFLSACLAITFGLEGLLGAFLCGLVINRIIPHGGPLMTRIEFVGNALFGLPGLIWAQAVSDAVNILITYLIYFRVRKRLG